MVLLFVLKNIAKRSLGGKLHLLEKKDDVMRNYLL
jgi:hypothetical protein